MSIMKYKNTGGTLPGQNPTNIPAGPSLPAGADHETTINAYRDWLLDPSNQPSYYTGSTVAGPGKDLLASYDQKRAAAEQTNTLTQDALARAQGRLDPNSEYNQQIAGGAASAVRGSGFGGGSRGGFRSDLAQHTSARDALDKSIRQTEQDITGYKGQLTEGADILAGIGQEQQAHAQRLIDEDIKRYNWTQLAPQARWDQIMNLGVIQEAIKQGKISATPGKDASSDRFWDTLGNAVSSGAGDLISGALGSLFNEGGMVPGYSNIGGPVDMLMGSTGFMPNRLNEGGFPGEAPMMGGDPMMQDPMAAPGAPQDPMMGNEMPMDPMAAGGPGMPAPAMGMEDPMMSDPMMDEMMMEPQSEIDKVESAVEELIATTGAPLTITRKTIIGKSKKKGG